MVFAHAATFWLDTLSAFVLSDTAILVSIPLSPDINAGNPCLTNAAIADGRLLTIRPIIGRKFPKKNVLTDDDSCCIAGPTFCPRAMDPSRFFADAFIASKDPLNVSDAS
jgi:hypothetical protein